MASPSTWLLFGLHCCLYVFGCRFWPNLLPFGLAIVGFHTGDYFARGWLFDPTPGGGNIMASSRNCISHNGRVAAAACKPSPLHRRAAGNWQQQHICALWLLYRLPYQPGRKPAGIITGPRHVAPLEKACRYVFVRCASRDQ